MSPALFTTTGPITSVIVEEDHQLQRANIRLVIPGVHLTAEFVMTDAARPGKPTSPMYYFQAHWLLTGINSPTGRPLMI